MSRLSRQEIKAIAEATVLATSTFYDPDSEGDKIRQGLAKTLVRSATELGYEVVVVDGGSADELLREFERYGARVFAQVQKGMGHGRRQAFTEGTKLMKKVTAWVEPEKKGYVLRHLGKGEISSPLAESAVPILETLADIVVPERISMRSYPRTQQLTETAGKVIFGNLTGSYLDMWFGPKVWGRELSHYFLYYKGVSVEDGGYGDRYDSIIVPVMEAMINGERVVGVRVDYTHPAAQTRSEEGNPKFDRKYIDQLESIVRFTADYWGKSLKAKTD